jgi:hypothetical protein
MSDGITVKIEGLNDVVRHMSDPRVKYFAMRRMDNGGRIVIDAAKTSSDMPVNNGQTRASMTWHTKDAGSDVITEMGSPLKTAPYMEFGTGTQSDGPGGTRRPHYPPPDALRVWCQRHGMAGMEFVVARAIGRRGGLKPRKFLRNATEQSLGRVKDEMSKVLDDVAGHIAKG